MPLVTTNEMLKKAQAGHYAVGAFNVENMEMVMAVIKAAEEMNSPVIMQTTPSTVKYAGLDYYLAMVRTAAERASVPVAIHLDHGSSFELAMQALRTGYTSIMIDGSHGSFEENVALTRRVADACLPSQISVEAELGKVGGKEDDLEAENDSPYTDPQQAKEFAERTNATSLAVAIGTAHGLYQGTPKLDFERRVSALQYIVENKAKGKVIVLIVLYLLLAVLVILNAYVEKYSVGLCVLSGGIALVGVYFAILHIVALTKMK